MAAQSKPVFQLQPALGMLGTLPFTVRENVYHYLLSVEATKKYDSRATELQLRSEKKTLYHFELNVLRVHEEARAVFLRNGLIKVTFNSKQAEEVLRGQEKILSPCPINLYWNGIEAALKNVRLEVAVMIQPCGCPGEACAGSNGRTLNPLVFLVFTEELPTLVAGFQAFLQYYRTGFDTTFTLNGQLPEKAQGKLLFPFKSMTGSMKLSRVTFAGRNVHKRIVPQIQDSMAKVLWFRGYAWKVYNQSLEMKHDADHCFLAGNMKQAYELYERAGHSMTRNLNNLKEWVFDSEFLAAFHRLDTILAANQMLAMAHGGALPAALDPCDPGCCACRPIFQSNCQAPQSYYATVCLLHHAAHITSGSSRDPTGGATCLIPVKSASLKALYAVVHDALWMGMYGGRSGIVGLPAPTEAESEALVSGVRSLLPTRPFGDPKVQPYTNPVAIHERAIARSMGIVEEALACDEIVDIPATTVNRAVVQKYAKFFEQQRRRAVKQQSKFPKEDRQYLKEVLNMDSEDLL